VANYKYRSDTRKFHRQTMTRATPRQKEQEEEEEEEEE
jgi:hypothetical protein